MFAREIQTSLEYVQMEEIEKSFVIRYTCFGRCMELLAVENTSMKR